MGSMTRPALAWTRTTVERGVVTNLPGRDHDGNAELLRSCNVPGTESTVATPRT
jgi:hypothetical protein